MRAVGIRELKNRLSEYLRQVRAGESVLVTDRGEVVAALTPPDQMARDDGVPGALLGLARQGLVTLGAPGDESLYPPLPRTRQPKRTSAQLLDAERGPR